MNKLTKVSLIASLLIGASFSASADDFIPTDITAKLERHLATQMQEMMVTAQQELTLSLQAQLSESLFDTNLKLAETAKSEDAPMKSAMVKE